MAAMSVQFECLEQFGKFVVSDLWRRKSHVVFNRPPGQQPRLLKHHSDPCVRLMRDAPLIVVVETGHDLQHGTLSAAGRAYEYANRSSGEQEIQLDEDVETLAGGIGERLARDI